MWRESNCPQRGRKGLWRDLRCSSGSYSLPMESSMLERSSNVKGLEIGQKALIYQSVMSYTWASCIVLSPLGNSVNVNRITNPQDIATAGERLYKEKYQAEF